MSTNLSKSKNHHYFMKLALLQANKNLGNTRENPSVGCIITNDNNVISAGSTSINGRPHAEYNAIKFLNQKFNNKKLYVTLEPCAHFGKTPPCVNLIMKSKFKEVFFSINDLDKRSFNKSSSILRKKGIKVNKGICFKEVNNFYRSYKKAKENILPFVTVKLAVSKDFFMVNKEKKWITNEYSRSRAHIIRSEHDCIMTSAKTLIKDNSRLTCRINGLENTSPTRIILDRKLNSPLNLKIFKYASKIRTIIFHNDYNKRKIKLFKKNKVETYKVQLDKNNNLDLSAVLKKVKKMGFHRILLEAGPSLSKSFIIQNLADDLRIFISKDKIGKSGIFNIKNFLSKKLKNKKKNTEKLNLFGDSLISYKLK